MGISGESNSYYSGTSCHLYVESLLRKGGKVLIVSPYIDRYYAKFIMQNMHEKDVRIISSSMDKEAMEMLSGSWDSVTIAGTAALLGLVEVFGFVAGANIVDLSSLLFAVGLFAIALLRLRRGSVRIKVPREFVHAKLYVSESEAIHGSANLTYNGMHKNIEHIEIVRDKEAIGRLRNEFMHMWDEA